MELWNFRRGIDWASDPLGSTVLPNHVFIDGIQGDDNNDGLMPSMPLKTLTRAKFLYPDTHTLICAPARYVDQYGGPDGEFYSVIGDSEDQDVVMIDSLGNRNGIRNPYTENITLVGFLSTCPFISRRIVNCTFVDCGGGIINRSNGCRYINTPMSVLSSVATGGVSAESSVFLNCPITHDSTILNTPIKGSFFDSNSTLNLINGGFDIQASHFENKLTWDVPGNNYQTSNSDGDAFLQDIGLLNFSIDPINSPLFGRGFPDGFVNPRHMAKFYVGNGFYSGISSFDTAISNNPNLDVVSNEILNVGPNDIEFLETEEFSLSSIQTLGIPFKVGIISYLSTVIGSVAGTDSLNRIIEIKYSSNNNDPLGPYKKYRFGERVTENQNGISNGDPLYSWANNIPVRVKRFQARIGIVKAGVI